MPLRSELSAVNTVDAQDLSAEVKARFCIVHSLPSLPQECYASLPYRSTRAFAYTCCSNIASNMDLLEIPRTFSFVMMLSSGQSEMYIATLVRCQLCVPSGSFR